MLKTVVLTLFLVGFGASVQAAETVKPSKQMTEFFSFSLKSQDGFISTSVMMLAVIAAQTEPKIAKCVDNWYNRSRSVSKKRNGDIIKMMRKLPQYTPTTIVLAVVEKECGKFKRSPK